MDRIIVLPDLHSPNVNWEAVAPVLQFIAYYKPTKLVQLGDLCNFDSLSSYEPRNPDALRTKLSDEVDSANNLIDRIEKVLPTGCQKFITGGNHEARVPKFIANHGSKTEIAMLYRFKTWQEEYNLEKRGWKSKEYGEWFEIGHIIFTHGWFISGNHSQRHLNLFHKNIVYGHTHSWQVATGAGIDGLPIMSASIGTLSTHDLAYLIGKPPVNWMSMFLYVDMKPNGQFTPHFTTIINSRFFEFGREFGGNNATKGI